MRAQTIVALATMLTVATPASAQDFLGGLARSAARSAAQSLANRAVQAATQPRRPATAPASTTPTPAPRPSAPLAPQATPHAAAEASSSIPAPVPTNLSPRVRSPGDFEFSQADEDAKRAYTSFGKVPCNSCEGGFSFDTWAQHQIPGMFGKLESHLWGLSVGESLRSG